METVTEDTYDLYGRQRSTSFNPGTAEHEASNTALGSFVLGIFWREWFTYYVICKASRGSGSQDEASHKPSRVSGPAASVTSILPL